MKTMILSLTVLMSVSAFAADSTWMLCEGNTDLYGNQEPLVVNVYEHRSPKGDGRETNLAFIFGANILTGTFDSSNDDAGKIKLASSNSKFAGDVKVDYSASKLSLKGKLSLQGSATNVNASLNCKVVRD